jgi:hypothetical protein
VTASFQQLLLAAAIRVARRVNGATHASSHRAPQWPSAYRIGTAPQGPTNSIRIRPVSNETLLRLAITGLCC